MIRRPSPPNIAKRTKRFRCIFGEINNKPGKQDDKTNAYIIAKSEFIIFALVICETQSDKLYKENISPS